MKRVAAARVLVAAVIGFSMAGCDRPQEGGSSTLTNLEEREVIALSEKAIQSEGFRLENHLRPEVTYDGEGYWRVTFRGKGDTPGDWVGVIVDDRTRAVEVIPGL